MTFFFQKTWTKGHWPLDNLLTPSLLRSHVWLYPRIIVSKSHENTSKYVYTVTLMSKTWTKGHWSLDDLWPHVCWGHMCDFTQGSLYPSPMGIHQCMWTQWSILQNTTYYIHIHLAKLIPMRFLKPAVCKYPTTVNNSEIYILLPKPCPWMWHLMCGNRVRDGSDRKPKTGKTRSLKLALFKNPIGAAL